VPRKTDHLQYHGGKWRVRLAVPADVRPTLGTTVLIQPLGTSDKNEANRAKGAWLDKFRSMIEEARNPSTRDPELQRAKALRRKFADATDTDQQVAVIEAADDYARDNIEDRQGFEAGTAFLGMVIGHTTPLDFHLEDWLADRGFHGKTKTLHRRSMRVLEEWCAEQGIKTLQGIDHRTALRFRDRCLRVRLGAPKTINRYLSTYRTYWKWVMPRERLEANPWLGTSDDGRWRRKNGKDTDNGDATKREFTDDEIAALLSGDAPAPIPDLMMIAALSGARISAICDLQVKDCQDDAFTFAPAKSETRPRQVPIHSKLRDIIARRTKGKRPGDFLFHELPEASDTRPRSAAMVQAFTRYRRKVGVGADAGAQSEVDFHSFRRWFITKASHVIQRGANKGFNGYTLADVVGHSREEMPLGMTMGRYAGPSEMTARRACVEAVKLPTASGQK
jgi:site-specific recombinase XerC